MAGELHAELGVDLDRPVDVFKAIDRLGIVLAFAPLGRVSGVYVPSVGSSGISKVVFGLRLSHVTFFA